MAAVVMEFRRPSSRGPTAVSGTNVSDRQSRARRSGPPTMSVPEAAFATFFRCLDPADAIQTISRLTGVTEGELRGLWRDRPGLRQAALRYALDTAFR